MSIIFRSSYSHKISRVNISVHFLFFMLLLLLLGGGGRGGGAGTVL